MAEDILLIVLTSVIVVVGWRNPLEEWRAFRRDEGHPVLIVGPLISLIGIVIIVDRVAGWF